MGTVDNLLNPCRCRTTGICACCTSSSGSSSARDDVATALAAGGSPSTSSIPYSDSNARETCCFTSGCCSEQQQGGCSNGGASCGPNRASSNDRDRDTMTPRQREKSPEPSPSPANTPRLSSSRRYSSDLNNLLNAADLPLTTACQCGPGCPCPGCSAHGTPPPTQPSSAPDECPTRCETCNACAVGLTLPSGIEAVDAFMALDAHTKSTSPATALMELDGRHASDTWSSHGPSSDYTSAARDHSAPRDRPGISPPTYEAATTGIGKLPRLDPEQSPAQITLPSMDCCGGRCGCGFECNCDQECDGCCEGCKCSSGSANGSPSSSNTQKRGIESSAEDSHSAKRARGVQNESSHSPGQKQTRRKYAPEGMGEVTKPGESIPSLTNFLNTLPPEYLSTPPSSALGSNASWGSRPGSASGTGSGTGTGNGADSASSDLLNLLARYIEQEQTQNQNQNQNQAGPAPAPLPSQPWTGIISISDQSKSPLTPPAPQTSRKSCCARNASLPKHGDASSPPVSSASAPVSVTASASTDLHHPSIQFPSTLKDLLPAEGTSSGTSAHQKLRAPGSLVPGDLAAVQDALSQAKIPAPSVGVSLASSNPSLGASVRLPDAGVGTSAPPTLPRARLSSPRNVALRTLSPPPGTSSTSISLPISAPFGQAQLHTELHGGLVTEVSVSFATCLPSSASTSTSDPASTSTFASALDGSPPSHEPTHGRERREERKAELVLLHPSCRHCLHIVRTKGVGVLDTVL